MKRINKWILVTTVAISAFLLVAWVAVPSGTRWVTLFGTDCGLSTSKGNLNISVGTGGFYYWWQGFSNRDFKPINFGYGYDANESVDSDWRFFPAISRPREKFPSTLELPIWIIVAILIGSMIALIRVRNKQAEQGEDDQAATAL